MFPPNDALRLLSVIKEFQDFSIPDLQAIEKNCNWHCYESDEEIVRYHDYSNSVFLIVEGKARVNYYSIYGKEVILCDLCQGEIFGELTAIDHQPRSATVIAREKTLIASMPSESFLELIYINRNFSNAILLRLTGQIRRLTERIFESETLKVPNRIRAKLFQLAQMGEEISNNEAIISLTPTHEELACLIGTHREAVTRELNDLKKHKIITYEDHRIHVLNMKKLYEMIHK
ncbi:MAG: Crp/Fnr family transcriptional regulator [Nitrosomonas sp.]|nr:Crp/Fnr family transcriptional regulator [Nitrosomonas sp.]